jgi:hypothetical protein
MSFSLAQGWIKRPAGGQLEESYGIVPETIQAEVEGMRKVVELYKTLVDQTPSDNLVRQIQEVIQSEHWAIFLHQKV